MYVLSDDLHFVDLNEDNCEKMADKSHSGDADNVQDRATTNSPQLMRSPLELMDQTEFTYDSLPNGDSPSHAMQIASVGQNGAADGSSTSGGSMTPLHGSPFHSPMQSAGGTVPFARQRSAHRDRLSNVAEENLASFDAEDRGFEMVPRPENPVEAHRLANNYMVSWLEVHCPS